MGTRAHLGRQLIVISAASLALLLAGCEGTDQQPQESEPATGQQPAEAQAAAPPFGTAADVERAASLWQEMADYKQDWAAYPGLDGWQEGKSPHGAVLRYYVNETAAAGTTSFEDGAILVKENYSEESEDALKSVTAMQKVAGYDPDHANWFWVKFAPGGDVMANEKDMKLAGRVAKGMDKGCIACHAAAAGGDYVFANDD